MCDLLSQQQQQQQTPSTQQRTGQKLSSRQMNKNQNHLSLMDTTTPTNALSSTINTSNTTTRAISNSPEVSSHISTLSTNSNRLNSSNNVNCRSSKSRQQLQQSDLNSSLENVITTDIVTVMSSAANNAINNNNNNSTDVSGIYKSWSPKENSNVKQQQNCSSANETLPTLTDSTGDQQYSITKSEQRSKLLNSTNDAHLLHNNQSDSISKNDQSSVNSSRSPHSSPVSPLSASSSAGAAELSPASSSPTKPQSPCNHSRSPRKIDDSQWNNTIKDGNMLNSCSNIKPVTDATEKLNLPSKNISTSQKSFNRQLKSLKNVDNPNLSSRCSEDGSNVKEGNEDGEEEEEEVEDQEDGANRNHDDSIEDDSDDNNNNNNSGEAVGDNTFFLMEQDSLSQHYSTSALSNLASSDAFGSCISPTMLAAAAMAALTSGCFPGPCNMANQFNPLLATKPYGFPSYPSNLNLTANSQRTQLTKQQQQTTPFTHSSLNRNSKMSHNINNSMSQQSNLPNTDTMNMSSLSSHSPIHSVHNSNKSLQDDLIGQDYSTNLSHHDTNNNISSMNLNQTPPPPLSRSNSPTHQSNRLMTTSNDLAYMSMDDGDEENDDEMGSEEIEEDMEAENPNQQSGNHQWTFEEQFKQLYVISDDPKRKEFLDELFVYMQKRGTPVNRIPIMAKQVLDLYELFQLVVARGGLVEVINKKLWREITKGLNLPSSITSAAFTLRTQYMKYLYPYECETLGLSSPSELQAAIDGNRREARRSSYSFDYPTVAVPNVGSRSVSPSSTTNPQTTTSNTTTNTESALNVAATSLSSTSVYLNSLAGSNVTTSGVNQILPSISGSSTPFCANSLGFNSQFGQFNPFLPIPPGTLPAAGSGGVGGSGLSIPSPSTLPSSSSSSSQIGNNPVNLFPPGFLPPIVSGAGFPMIASSFQGFNPATANNSDDSLITSSHQTLGNPSGGILPGVANSFTDPSAMAAAAAAAATLFGAGFPTIPAAFPMTSQQQHQSTTAFPVHSSFMNTDGGIKFPNMSMRNQSNNSCDIHENNPSRGVNLKNKLSLQDSDDCQFSSSLPLNLTASDNSINSNIMKLDEKGAAHSNNDRRTPLIQMDHDNLTKIQCDPENASLKLHSTDGYIEKDDENELSDSMGTLKNFSYHHHQNEDGENYDDNSMNTDRLFDSETEHSELRCKPELLLGGVNKHEVIGSNNNNTRLSQAGLSFENEESNMKTAAQMACQQLWVAAAAAAAGLHCGGNSMKTPDTASFTSLSSSLNGPMTKSNFHASNSHHQSSTESSTNNSSTHTHNHNSNSNKSLQHHSSSYSRSTGKKSHSRTPNSLDLPNSKISKLSSSNTNTNNNSNETGGKSYSSTSSTNLSSKKSQNSISDLRRSTDAITLSTSFSNTLGLNNSNGNNNNNSNSNSSFAAAQAAIATAQNLRIQTQPGAPMGLPQNAMVVTMEMGNILYQGVLFGQIKR
ncbi:unnamed protein product [Trichobilharzia szidati]|nr:unnamed protein product [Trichobilharzia szidati]